MQSTCSNCEGRLKIVGPGFNWKRFIFKYFFLFSLTLVWTGRLHDENFVKNVIENVTESNHITKDRILGMLQLVIEELPNPLYYVFDEVNKMIEN